MDIGTPREVKDGEARVGLTPEGAVQLVQSGHRVRVERGAGLRAGFPDEAYEAAGAELTEGPEALFACALVVKVKELQPVEYARLKAGTVLFAYQQLGRDQALLDAVLGAGVTCLAYENVVDAAGARPLLAPMSALAGTMSAQIAAWALQSRASGPSGNGTLLWAMEGLPPARVVVIGEGVSGSAAAEAFHRMGCAVTVLGRDAARLDALRARLGGTLEVAISDAETLDRWVPQADVVIGAVAIPGRRAPVLLPRELLRRMRPGSVFIDIGIDMGGIAETSRQTKLSDPLYLEEGIVHYGVSNIPAQVPKAASQALCVATLPWVQTLADCGLQGALAARPGLREGLLVHAGAIVHPGLAEDTGRPYLPPPF